MMPRFGYSPIQIQRVKVIIMATKLPQSPQNFLGELMADADLDVLGRDDFFISTLKLRAELEAYGRPTTLKEWYTTQLNFLESHTYFTTVANALRQDQKKKNIEGLKELLLKC
jgi:predicted metal-dependent HD superfamily phosphohydrolase